MGSSDRGCSVRVALPSFASSSAVANLLIYRPRPLSICIALDHWTGCAKPRIRDSLTSNRSKPMLVNRLASGIDELDECCILAEQVDFLRVNVSALLRALYYLENFGGVFLGLCLVDALQLDIHARLRLHIGYIAGQGQGFVPIVEGLDCIGDKPKTRFLTGLDSSVRSV
jgi:hypothetical protein